MHRRRGAWVQRGVHRDRVVKGQRGKGTEWYRDRVVQGQRGIGTEWYIGTEG